MKPGRRSSVPIATAVVTEAAASGAAAGSPLLFLRGPGVRARCTPGLFILCLTLSILVYSKLRLDHLSLISLCPSTSMIVPRGASQARLPERQYDHRPLRGAGGMQSRQY